MLKAQRKRHRAASVPVRTRRIILGPPGTGKTETLLHELGRMLEKGVAPDRVAFVSFSRRAVEEAKRRAREVTEEPLPHFRTIHSLAYRLLDLERGDVLQADHLTDFGNLIGLPLDEPGLDPLEGSPGTICLSLWGLAAARCTSLYDEWKRAEALELPWRMVERVGQAYEHYKYHKGLVDFADMLQKAHILGATIDVDVLFIDEAQDLSKAQWRLVRQVFSSAPLIVIAGDDDQAIYAWGGADPEQLLRFRGEREVLGQSYRVPYLIKNLADQITAGITTRAQKTYVARDATGTLRWVDDLELVDLSEGSWLLLARCRHQLAQLRELARAQGVVYTLPNGSWSWRLPAVRAAVAYERLRRGATILRVELKYLRLYTDVRPCDEQDTYAWTDVAGPGWAKEATWMEGLPLLPYRDREYLRALLRRGESVSKPGRVRISTVHGAKGAQADHVLLLTDVSERVAQAAYVDPDAERRVAYVGVTRARESLTLLEPATPWHWVW